MGSIGGINTGWDNTTPAAGDDSGLGDDHFRSIKTSLQEILDSEHDFTTAGGTKTGMHRHGSALPYVSAENKLQNQSLDTLGRLTVTSDTSRLFAQGDDSSRGTIYLGGVNSVEHQGSGTGYTTTTDTTDRNVIWVTQSGHTQPTAGGATVHFPNTGGTAYDGIPTVTASIWSTSIDPAKGAITCWFSTITQGGFQILVRQTELSGGAPQNSQGTIMWQSIGSVSL